MTKQRREHGDTIVELVMAFAIFSLAAVMTLIILNKGVGISQRSLEVTQVRQQMDAQAEMVRYIRDSASVEQPGGASGATWQALKEKVSTPKPLNGECPTSSNNLGSAFFLTSSNGVVRMNSLNSSNFSPAATYAQIDSEGISRGIWTEITKAEQATGSVAAYDLYIHGCWNSFGSTQPVTLGTIVRIYDR